MTTRYWTYHWQNRYWRNDVNPEYEPVCSSGSNTFRKRGVSVGDVVYVVSLADGQLFLGGRMIVKRIVSREEAVQIWDNDNLYDANEWIIDEERSGTPLNLHRRLSPEISRQLRFVSRSSESKGLFFISDSHLDIQTTRGVRQLTQESAALLDRIIEVTDQIPRRGELITVTEELLRNKQVHDAEDQVKLPEEVPLGQIYSEGKVQCALTNRYERDIRAREQCIAHYGTSCILCGFDFAVAYGEAMAGYIHVHHLKPLSSSLSERWFTN